jgi:hypothetical protein
MKKKASGNYELHSTFKAKPHGSIGASRQTSRIQTHTNTNNSVNCSSGAGAGGGGESNSTSCCVFVQHEINNIFFRRSPSFCCRRLVFILSTRRLYFLMFF